MSTPGSALFRHFLSPAAYTARFGASPAAARQAEIWLRAEGFTGIAADSGRTYVRATAPVSKINAAFRVRLQTYRPSASANDGSGAAARQQPRGVAARLAGRRGAGGDRPGQRRADLPGREGGRAAGRLRERSRQRPAHGPKVACSHYYGQHMATGLPKHFGVTSFPTFVCGYSAPQMRAAYGANWVNTGKGQTIALVEQGLTRNMFGTLQDYAKANHMPAPSPERYAQLSLGENTCGDPFNIEEQLDVESSYDMAPGANQLVVGGDSCDTAEDGNQSVYDADIVILDGASGHPLATVASNSWESGTESQPLSQTNLVHAYLMRAAAEGVGMYFSAGDGSGVLEPSIDPYAIAVGGTTLGIGQTGQRLFETGWSTGISQLKNNAWHFAAKTAPPAAAPACTGPSRATRRAWCRSHWAPPAARRTSPPTPTRSPASTWAC